MEDKRNIKEYTEAEIDKMNNPLELYNLLLRPVQKMKEKIESSEKQTDAVVAVYGATTYPLLRRINALNKLSHYVDLDNGIIFSGGRSWTSVVSSSHTFRPSLSEIKDYIDKSGKDLSQYSKEEIERIEERIRRQKINKYIKLKDQLIRKRAVDILKEFPEIKDKLYNREKEIWENYLDDYKKEYEQEKALNPETQKSIPPTFKSYDEMYDNYLNKKIESKKSGKELRPLYNMYRTEKGKNKESVIGFNHWYKKYKKNNSIGKPFFKWLKDYYDKEHYEELVMRKVTEVDLMEIKLGNLAKEELFSKIIEDKKATNSAENAVNTVEEFSKLKEKNPALKKLIVISEWQYLLRQVLTTQKAANDKGLNDIEIIGYPADMDYHNEIALRVDTIDKFNSIMKNDLKKIATYHDVADYTIDEKDKKSPVDDNMPKIYIRDITLADYLNQRKNQSRNKDSDEEIK